MDQQEKTKNTASYIALIVFFGYALFSSFSMLASKTLAWGFFPLNRSQSLIYSLVSILLSLVLLLGLVRKTKWIWLAGISYYSISIAKTIVFNFIFSKATNEVAMATMAETLKKAGSVDISQMTSLIGFSMMIGSVFSLIFYALIIVFLCLNKKHFHKDRLI